MEYNLNEEIAISIDSTELGLIDLLVSEDIYSSRTDFINKAIKNQLQAYSEETKKMIIKSDWTVGILVLTMLNLQQYEAKGVKVNMNVVGMLIISDDISFELIKKTVKTIKVMGSVRCNAQIKKYYNL
jgi:metal-responsive CopG/Arc/MetJ family transcriptional regulator